MTKVKKYLITCLSLLLFSPLCGAEEAYDLTQLQSLFNAYQRQQAYDYANKYLREMEGDPYFDYIYGVSAIDTGHASQGVFALERVLLTFPNDHVARLELARGYFILEEYARSREEFESVMAIEPPKPVQETALRYLDMIRLREARYRTTSNGYVEIAAGMDDNVNSGVDAAALLIIPDLTEESLGQKDNFIDLTAAWQITHPFAPGWLFNSAITGSARQNQDYSEYDNLTATIQLGMTRIFKESRYKVSMLAQQFNLDSEKYRSMSGINLEWHYALSQKAKFNTDIQYVQMDYPDFDTRNSALSTLSLGYTYTFSGSMSPTLFTNINIGTEAADNGDDETALANTERDITGARVGLLLSLSPKVALQTSASVQTNKYGGPQTLASFLGATRDEELISAEANILWLLNRDWRLDIKTSYLKNSSNVGIYEYDRTLISTNIQYAF